MDLASWCGGVDLFSDREAEFAAIEAPAERRPPRPLPQRWGGEFLKIKILFYEVDERIFGLYQTGWVLRGNCVGPDSYLERV